MTEFVRVEGDINLSEIDLTTISRSVFVTGFPTETKWEELVIHFQRRKNGGGDIKKIIVSKKGTAVMIFDDPEVVSTIQQQEQHFQGVNLSVKPYLDAILSKSDQHLEVFEVVSADIDLEFVQTISREETKALLGDIANKTGVRWIERAEIFSISGTFEQVQQTRNFLKETVIQSNGVTVFTGLKSKGESLPERLTDKSHNETENKEDISQNTSNGSRTPLPFKSKDYEVEPKIFKVFAKAYKKDLEDIEAKYHVEVPRKPEGSKLSPKPKGSCTANDYEEACNQFITLYQKMFQRITMERFSLKSEKTPVPARDVINKISKTFPVSVEICKDRKHWELYGEVGHIEEALKYLKEEGVEIKREQEQALDADSHGHSNGLMTPSNRLEAYLDENVKFSVYKGDITMESVDAIVNAANKDLAHGAGIAKAILDRGGRTIREESRSILQKHGLLKDGEAVRTNSGNLPCKVVIHAVGPEWTNVGSTNSKRILREACLNAFYEAEKLSLVSIAMPAIGSGSHGMPKDVCAEVMLDAVEDYVSKVKPKNKMLTDIRFVDTDELSVQAFMTEFRFRYDDKLATECGGNLKAQPAKSNRGRNRKGKASRGGGSTNNSLSSSDDRDDPSSAPASSYSGAVKRNAVHEKDTLVPTRGDGAKADHGDEEKCPICLDDLTKPRRLNCQHVFCSECLQTALNVNNKCPVCQEPQVALRGNQPRGVMTSRCERYRSLPGYPGCGTIIIQYNFPSGTQGPEHPHPGQYYEGTSRQAYLPDNREGQEVLKLLKIAFDARLVFTIGTSNTTGRSNQVIWNDIHHKTSVGGGPFGFGYPDPDYLRRVKEELAAKGIR